jgi:aminoglycoside phosphotransferase (APT) family kinase protein
MPDRAAARHHQLVETLHGAYGHLGITSLRQIGQGMDARVYRGTSPELGPVAVKLPHDRWVSSGNEPRLDTRRLLRQEFQLGRHLREHGLPVPEVFLFHADDDGVDFTVSAFIEPDGSQLADAEFGRLIRAVHEVPVPAIDLVAMDPSADVDEVLADRIGQRLKNLTAIADLGVGNPDIGVVLAAGRPDDAAPCLLHMDLRPENILTRAGRPAALLDWSNALVGEAALDLARAAEYGSLTGPVLSAYGDTGVFSVEPRTPREMVYRLDTAVMLSHVFLDGAPDKAKARHYIHRTRSLCAALLKS